MKCEKQIETSLRMQHNEIYLRNVVQNKFKQNTRLCHKMFYNFIR